MIRSQPRKSTAAMIPSKTHHQGHRRNANVSANSPHLAFGHFGLPRPLRALWSGAGLSSAERRSFDADTGAEAARADTAATERRLRIAAEMADLYVFEADFVNRTLKGAGVEQSFFEQPLTYQALWDQPFAIVAPEHREAVEAAWESYLAGREPYRAEFRVVRHDGRTVWAFASGELTRDQQGRPLAFVGALQNITERKLSELELAEALDRAQAASRAKSEFLAAISHEVCTPLNGVLGMAQVMAKHELTPAQAGRLALIRQSGESLSTLLNGVLDIAKIEAGKLQLHEGEVDIGRVAREVLDDFEDEAVAKGLALTLDITLAARGVYLGDAARVKQVLGNMVSNAVKFTDRGSVLVAVDRRDAALVLCVRDTGIGVSAEQRLELFQTFSQGDASATRRHGGSGLGLAICRRLVEKMDGAIGLESEPGQGATVTVTLPLPRLRNLAETPSAASEAPPHAVDSSEQRAVRVLAAEDNPVNQAVLQALLHPFGIDPVMVGDGEQALTAWRDGDWDLILMDIQMPRMDGVTAARAIRQEERRNGCGRTPIVALTANVMPHQVEAYLAAGMDAAVGKPIEIRRLLAAIEAALTPTAAPSLSSRLA
jgi:signal transduction histidine kinase